MRRITDLLSPTYFVKNATLLWKPQGWCEKRNAFVKNAMLTWKTQPLCKKHNTYVKNATLKRTVQRDFWPPFFHHLNLPRPLINRLKHFRIWLRFRRVIQIFLKYLPGVSYRGESVFPKYHTLESHSWPRGVNCQFLNCLHRPLKVQCHKNKCGIIIYY